MQHLEIVTCAVEGCNDERYVTTGGRVYKTCKAHLAAAIHRKPVDVGPVKLCIQCGVRPIHVRSSGERLPRCIECTREYKRNSRRRQLQLQSRQPQQPEPVTARGEALPPPPPEAEASDIDRATWVILTNMALMADKATSLVRSGIAGTFQVSFATVDGIELTFGTQQKGGPA